MKSDAIHLRRDYAKQAANFLSPCFSESLTSEKREKPRGRVEEEATVRGGVFDAAAAADSKT